MRKRTIILIIIILALSYYIKSGKQSTQANLPNITQNASTQLVDLEKNQKRQIQLKNPQIIEQNLKRVGNLTTFEGQQVYKHSVDNNGSFSFTTRIIDINFLYRFGIGLDLGDVHVVQIVSGNIVYLKIPIDKIRLQYIEKIENQSTLEDEKKFSIGKHFTSIEYQKINANSQEDVANKIGANKEYFNVAEKNLEIALNEFILKLGFTQVIFL